MIVKAESISKSFGPRLALDRVSIGCQRGSISGLIGPNGAGKSTLFRILLGLIKADSGSLEINSTAAKPIGGIIDRPALFGYLNAFENLKVFSAIQEIELDRARAQALLHRVGLDPERDDPVRNYSSGMKQRLGLAIALINNPECIILDEPFSGLDPLGIRSFQELVRRLARKSNIAVLISSHQLSELADLCDRLYVIQEGVIRKEGAADELFGLAVGSYLIRGEALNKSKILNSHNAQIGEGKAWLSCKPEEIGRILAGLIEEGTVVSACIPQTDLNTLFETAPE